MGYAIIWISYLAFWLLLLATISAFGARLKSIFFTQFWPLLAFWLILLINLVPVVTAIIIRVENISPAWLLPYTLILFICFVVGSRLILYKGLKKSEDQFTAYQWPRSYLSIASGIVLCIFLITLHIMDLKAIADQNRLLVSTTGEAVELLPGKLPEDLDAGKYYDQASKVFAEKKKPEWFDIFVLDADFIPESDEVADFINANQEVLDLIKLAGDRPGLNMEANPSNLTKIPIYNFGTLRDLMRLVGLSAKVKALHEGPGAALAELEPMKKLSDQLRQRPMLIDQMMAVALDGIRASILEFVLSREPIPENSFIVKPIKPSFSIIPFLQQTIRFEDVQGRQAFSRLGVDISIDDFFGDNLKMLKSVGRLGNMLYRIFMLPDDLESLKEIQKHIKQLTETFEKPFPEAIKNLNDLNNSFSENQSVSYYMRQYMPSFSVYYERVNNSIAQRRFMDLALAATAYRADKGEFPTSLEVLVPEYIETLPDDPLDGKPMKYNAMDGGLDIYSIGWSSIESRDHFYLGAELYNKYRYQPALKRTNRRKKR
jgi:hypothetical protein